MAENNKPQDDAKAMRDEYVKGVTIDDIAQKYNHTTQEVTEVVVQEAHDDEPVLQADQPEPETAKKGK